jgi:SAM-dependent methyltransferase
MPNKVFLSYSHKDERWLTIFKDFLKPYIQGAQVMIWDDSQIMTGQPWRRELKSALLDANAAILLVTPNFLASDFIAKEELPPLLIAAERQGLMIFWVPVSYSGYKQTPIADYQATFNPDTPLDTLSPARRNKALVAICSKIKDALESRDSLSVVVASTSGNQLDATIGRILAQLSSGTVFSQLAPESARSPLEMIKEDPEPDDLTSIMAHIPSFTSLQSQIDYVHKQRFANLYIRSWVESEVQLIGASLLSVIKAHLPTPCRFYDAGSGSFGQYAALLSALGTGSPGKVVYYAQDYNDDWNTLLHPSWGRFLNIPLPAIEGHDFDLIACAHVLQDMAQNPLAIYSSVFSFNRVLKTDGICYITVPYKDSIPGILDVIGIAASDAGFCVMESGCWRLQFTESLKKHDPLGITTFGRVVIRKKTEVAEETWRQLVGASFLRWGHHALSTQFGVSHEHDIAEETRLKERDIREILVERNLNVRTFQWVTNRFYGRQSLWEQQSESLGIQDVASRIRKQIHELHDVYVGSQEAAPELSKACASYLFWLLAWLFHNYRPVSHQSVISTINPPVIECLKSPRDVRVHIEDLSADQVGRLIRHLFELCEFRRVDIRKSFDLLISVDDLAR